MRKLGIIDAQISKALEYFVCQWKEMGFLDWTFPEPRWGLLTEGLEQQNIWVEICSGEFLSCFSGDIILMRVKSNSWFFSFYIIYNKLFLITHFSIATVAYISPSFSEQGIASKINFLVQ